MNTLEILTALKVKNNSSNKSYCSQLAKFYTFFSKLKNITNAKIDLIEDIYFENSGKLPGANLTVQTLTGSYKMQLPINNDYYFSLCTIVGIECHKVKNENFTSKFLVPGSTFLDQFKKAAKFVCKDELRPAMTCILLEVDLINKNYIYAIKFRIRST